MRAAPAWSVLLALGLWLLPGTGGAARAAGPEALEVRAPTPELAAQARRAAQAAWPGLVALIGTAPARVRLEVAADQEDFAARARAVGGPQWAAGLAVPGQGLVLLRPPRLLTDPGAFPEVLVHELAHLFLAVALGQRRVPLWLEEGVAMHASQEGGFGRAGRMAEGVLLADLFPLAELADRFPAEEEAAALAYAQSYYFIGFLLAEHGPDVVARLLASLAAGRELTVALRQVTGKGLAQLEREYQEAMRHRFSWLALLFAAGTLWGLVSLGAGVGLVLRRRTQLHRRRLLDASPPPAPAGRRKRPPFPPRGDVRGAAGLHRPGDEPPRGD